MWMVNRFCEDELMIICPLFYNDFKTRNVLPIFGNCNDKISTAGEINKQPVGRREGAGRIWRTLPGVTVMMGLKAVYAITGMAGYECNPHRLPYLGGSTLALPMIFIHYAENNNQADDDVERDIDDEDSNNWMRNLLFDP